MINQVGGMRDPSLLKKADIEHLFQLAEKLNSILEHMLEINTENSLSQAGLNTQFNSVEMIPSSHSSSEVSNRSPTSVHNRRPVHTKKTALNILPKSIRDIPPRGTETYFSGGASSSHSKKITKKQSLDILPLIDILSKNTMCFQKDSHGKSSSTTLRKWMTSLKVHSAFLTLPSGDTKFLEFKKNKNFKTSNIKQSNLNETNISEIVKSLLSFEDRSILINRKFPLNHNISRDVRNTFSKDLYKMPSETKCGFIKYDENYAITTRNLLIILQQRILSTNYGKKKN